MSSESTPLEQRTDPVHGFSGRLLAALDRVETAPAWALTPDEQVETVLEMTRALARLSELRLRVLAAADRNEVAAKSGATSTAAWLAEATQQTRADAHADVWLARALDDEAFRPTQAALAAGLLTQAQARVVVRAIADLPDGEVTAEQRERAQHHLIVLAGQHDARQLRLLGRRVYEVLAPDDADSREGEALEREEHRAHQRCAFSMRDAGDGTMTGWFRLPTLQAEMLGKAVQAFAAPRRARAARLREAGERRHYRLLLGQAFAELVEHLPAAGLPQAGGVAAAVVVTVPFDMLRSGVGAAALDTGGRISAGEVRRLACNSGIIPAVLDSASVPMDLGRTRRLHTTGQRIAMAVRDQGCTARGCDRPAAWCEAHHERPWSQGGRTSVDDGRLLCPQHHRMAHDRAYDVQRLPDGKVRFARRT